MCYNNINIEVQKNCRILNKGPPQSSIQYFVVPDQISHIGYLRISGNKWHVKFALSFIILQEYTHLFHNKVTSFTISTRYMYVLSKHGCPGSNKVKIWQTYLTVCPTFWHPRGAWDVSEVWGSNIWTNSPSLFTVSSTIGKL